MTERINNIIVLEMDNDPNVKKAFDRVNNMFASVDLRALKPSGASGIIAALKGIDEVLRVIF